MASISELRKLNAELRLVNQTMRHDILNRLFFIGGIVGNYQKFGEKSMKLDEMLTEIRNMVKNSADFIQGMKEVEIDAVTSTPLHAINVRQIVEKMMVDFTDLSITISGSGVVLADQGVVSVVANLFQNIRVHASNSDVSVAISETNKTVKVAIADTGVGIPDTIKAQLFQYGHAFGVTGHTGIGLYVVKSMMDRYKGKVTIKDNHPHGTIFTLYFKKALL